MNKMQKSTCKYLTFTIYRYRARLAVTMKKTTTTGAATARLSQASYMQWSFVRVKTPIDSSDGHH